MALTFNADEILGIAVKIEQNGADFYRKAAGLVAGKENADYLLSLAAMEEDHMRSFEAMRGALDAAEKTQTTYDPDDETALYVAATADTHGGEGSPDAAAALTGTETMADILRVAIGLEKNSILFYLGIKNMVSKSGGRDKVEQIIDQEMGHVATLSRELRKAKG